MEISIDLAFKIAPFRFLYLSSWLEIYLRLQILGAELNYQRR